MRQRFPIVLGALVVLFSSSCSEQAATPPQVRPWFSGGTVHNADAARWKEVEPHNRLATCADVITTALLALGVNPGLLDIERIKPWATQLEACLDKAFADSDDGQVPDVAEECIAGLNLRWPPP